LKGFGKTSLFFSCNSLAFMALFSNAEEEKEDDISNAVTTKTLLFFEEKRSGFSSSIKIKRMKNLS